MFSHVTLGCDDLDAAGRFYDALLAPLGLRRRPMQPDGGPAALCWARPDDGLPRFFVFNPYDGRAASPGNGAMIAFAADGPAAVDAAYAAGMSTGGSDEGAPGERAHYGPGYYGAYLRDPGGNKVHIVHRGDMAGELCRTIAQRERRLVSGGRFSAFAEEWVDAFNAHDLERILAHYAEDVVLISPIYLQFTEGRSDEVSGIAALRDYFGAALARYPALRFTLLEVADGARGPCLRYHSNLGDRIAMECFELDGSGRAKRVLCHYNDG